MSLTPAGEVFLAEARAALDQLRRAEQIGRLAGRSEAGNLSIGYVFSAAVSGVLSRALSAVAATLPAMTAMPEPLDTPRAIDAVSNGRLHLGLIRPRPIYPAGLDQAVIHREPMVLALAQDHPLAGRRVEPAALASEAFIVPQFGEEDGMGASVARLARRAGFAPHRIVETRDFVTALSLAATGSGVSLVPRSIARLRLPGLRYAAVRGGTEEVELVLIWRSTGAATAAAIIREALAKAGGDRAFSMKR